MATNKELRELLDLTIDALKVHDRVVHLFSDDYGKRKMAETVQLLKKIRGQLILTDLKDIRWSEEEALVGTPLLVKVRPCADEFEGKTFLGFYLGDLAMSPSAQIKEDHVKVGFGAYNPAIFIPEKMSVVMGCASWWGPIKTEEELKQISDDDIANVWYVKALKDIKTSKEYPGYKITPSGVYAYGYSKPVLYSREGELLSNIYDDGEHMDLGPDDGIAFKSMDTSQLPDGCYVAEHPDIKKEKCKMTTYYVTVKDVDGETKVFESASKYASIAICEALEFFPDSRKEEKKMPARSKYYLDFVRRKHCLIHGCKRAACAHHVRVFGGGGVGMKVPDYYAVPLCGEHHNLGIGSLHSIGEITFWEKHNIDIARVIMKLNHEWMERLENHSDLEGINEDEECPF